MDTTARRLGSTVELTKPDATIVVEPGVTIIGDDNLASKTPSSASAAYATSIAALLGHLVRDGALSIDLGDPVQAEVVVAHDRSVLNDEVWQLILDEISLAGLPGALATPDSHRRVTRRAGPSKGCARHTAPNTGPPE